MSNKKKPKKLRTPNLAAAGLLAAAESHGGGAEGAVSPANAAGESRRYEFDYTHIRHDLRRSLVLAGALFAVLIALSFVLR